MMLSMIFVQNYMVSHVYNYIFAINFSSLYNRTKTALEFQNLFPLRQMPHIRNETHWVIRIRHLVVFIDGFSSKVGR